MSNLTTKYAIVYTDASRRYFQTLETLVDSLEDLDALNVSEYFGEYDNAYHQEFNAIDNQGEACLIITC